MRTITTLLLTASLLSASSVPPRVTRAAVAAMEKSFDRRLQLVGIEDPFYILGDTRGIYVDGFGVVFSTELNLIASAAPSPFRPAYTKEEIEKIRQKKTQRLEALKQNMREMLISSAASLDAISTGEQVVLGVTLFYYNWENTNGLPRQVVMQASKKALLEAMHGNKTALDAALRITEY